MDLAAARQILKKSVSNLEERRRSVTTNDLEADVINNACLVILKKQRDRMKKVIETGELSPIQISNIEDMLPVSHAFTDAAIELFPKNYNNGLAAHAHFAIMQNIEWEGMWDFLREYFQQNHGIQIDNIEATILSFYSTYHKRFENDNFTSESEVGRNISIQLIGDTNEVIVTIEPSLSPKKGYLVSKTDKEVHYRGHDSDYLFIVNLDDFEEIESFILEMPNRRLKIKYFE